MKNFHSIVYGTTEYGTCAKLTWYEFESLFTAEDLNKGEKRGEIETRGVWSIPVSYTALCVNTKNKTIYGYRTMRDIRQMGYDIEGRVSLNGKKIRGFSSSLMIELPDGRLFNCATIYACVKDTNE